MTDANLVRKKLALIETYIAELGRLARLEAIKSDVREERFVTHTLQLALQTTIDVAAHIVADERLGEPAQMREVFALLAKAEWLDRELAADLGRMVGLRNLLVHEYGRIDLELIRDIVMHRLGDLERFVSAVRSRLDAGTA